MCVVDLSAYNEIDHINGEPCNRLSQAMCLFEEIMNSLYLRDVMVFLFLDKKDVFSAKLSSAPITVCPAFQDFAGDAHSYEPCLEFIRDKFFEFEKIGTFPPPSVFFKFHCVVS